MSRGKTSLKKSKYKITVIIPAKNEGAGLKKIISETKLYASEIIVVDGHSTDNTKNITEKEKVVYLLDDGRGRGSAILMAVKKATNDTIVIVDADGSHEISDIPRLIKPIFDNTADLVITSRRTGGSSDMRMDFDGLLRSAGSDLLVMLTNNKFDSHLTDILYSFRAFNKKKFLHAKLTSKGFSMEQEMVISFLRKKYRVTEIPSREKARAWGESKLKTISGVGLFLRLIYDLYLKS